MQEEEEEASYLLVSVVLSLFLSPACLTASASLLQLLQPGEKHTALLEGPEQLCVSVHLSLSLSPYLCLHLSLSIRHYQMKMSGEAETLSNGSQRSDLSVALDDCMAALDLFLRNDFEEALSRLRS
ncbi:hypothetical protein JZ751_024750, partial [Albula glossodonta]